MPREVHKYLWDMQQACRLVTQFTTGQTLETYRNDPMLQSAVERQFEIVGEAMNQLLKQAPQFGEHFADARQIIAFRNMLIHGYRYVDHAEVWQITQDDLPRLQTQVDTLLEDLPEP